MGTARVAAIFVAPAARVSLQPVGDVLAVAGRGLEGDRYYLGKGALSRWPAPARAVSFVEQEVIDAVRQELGIDLSAGRNRRNVVTEGIRLNELKGRQFRIGRALFRGVQLCQPCGYLERLTQPGAFAALKGRGGLRAEVLETGAISVGDTIEVVPATSAARH